MDDRDKQIGILNTLTATTLDSVNGYEEAAQHLESEQLREVFRRNADERNKVAEQLRSEVRRLGGDPENDGSVFGKTHQRFLDIKAAITGRDEKKVVNEVERGEDYIKEKFEAALKEGKLSGETRAVVEQAYQSVRKGHDQVSSLKHGMETSS